jgi:hypothetical protein
MPFLMSLLGGLLSVCGSMVGRVLLALGIGFVTYKGFDTSISWLLSQVQSNMSAMPAQIASFLAFLWVDKAISMVFAAYSAALVVKVGTAGFSKMVVKGS